MKKNVFVFSALCLATMTLVFSGCKKENNDPQEPAKVQTYRMSINASKGTDHQANGPRKVIGLDGTTLNASWQAGEQVTVYNVTKGETLTGYLEAQTSGTNVQLDGTLTGTIEAGDKLTLKYLSTNYTGQNGTLAYISANCDYAVAEDVEVESVDGSTIYTTGTAAFVNQQAIVKFTLKDAADNTTLLSPTALTFHAGTADIATLTIPDATYTTNGEGVLYVAVPGFSGKDITLTATVGSDTYTFNKTSTTLTNGQYYILTVEMAKETPAVPAGALTGKFSVSPTLKVYFSKGNLQYLASTNTWRFAENQYDAVGGSNGSGDLAPYNTSSANHSPSDSQTGWIDLFGWATSNLNTPEANTYYQPWNTGNATDDNAKYGSGITAANVSWAAAHANYDWGKNMGDDWRTLTAEEWGYLIGLGNGGTDPLDQRANYQSLRGLCYITVSSTSYPGMIILPDDLYNNLPTATEGDIANKWAACAVEADNLTYYNTTFTEKEWTALQAAGAVFLPAAGIRTGTTVNGAGVGGYYWSSSASSNTDAFFLFFLTGGLLPESSLNRCNGHSVRLVQDVK